MCLKDNYLTISKLQTDCFYHKHFRSCKLLNVVTPKKTLCNVRTFSPKNKASNPICKLLNTIYENYIDKQEWKGIFNIVSGVKCPGSLTLHSPLTKDRWCNSCKSVKFFKDPIKKPGALAFFGLHQVHQDSRIAPKTLIILLPIGLVAALSINVDSCHLMCLDSFASVWHRQQCKLVVYCL